MSQKQTTYLWDLADTLFRETWNAARTGLPSYNAYIESLGYDLDIVDAKTYEWHYEGVFKDGRMGLALMPGFIETLGWTKHNAVFTTGNKEQIDWRAGVFIKQGLPDIRPFFERIYSTFDYGNTNKKMEAMFLDILEQELARGRSTVIYADNLRENCEKFQSAARQIPKIKTRLYFVNEAAEKTNKLSGNFYEVGGLPALLANEQSLA